MLGAVGSISLAFGFASAAFNAASALSSFGLAGLGDGAVDTTGQRRGLGHPRTGAGQGRGGSVHITFLQDDLAALQVGLGQLPLILLQAAVAEGIGLAGWPN